MANTHKYFDQALQFVMEAGKILLEGYKSPKEVSTKKSEHDFVTQYDKLIEKTLIDNLIKLFPTHKFIAEESAAQNVLTNDPTWIIDPIDGTTNFIQGFPFCCISLALSIEKNVILGIVYNPILNQLFTAEKGKGAYLNNEKIHVSNTDDLKHAMFGLDIVCTNNDKINQYLLKMTEIILKNGRGSRSLGSAAIELCYLAMGAIDICSFRNLKCWDVAAGVLIIQESGGIVLNSKGNQYTEIMDADIIAVCTKKIADHLINLTT